MIEIGKRVGNFEIKAEIGKGGMGTIFYAVDTMLNRDVALKVIHPQFTSNPQLMERFRIEAMAQARMNHPNIVMIFSFNKIDENYIIAMEYIDGKSLKDFLKEEIKLDVNHAMNYMKQILTGLDYAHSNNVIHRDIKPANIMITKDKKIKISDFGIAKIFGEQGLTKTGVMIGTPWYVSPEQILGKDIDFRTDLYSAGITFYEMLTGRVPFDSKTNSDFQIQKAHLETPPPRPSAFNSKIHPKLEKFILKALQKRPEKRFKNAKEMLEELIKIERDILRDTIHEDKDGTVVIDSLTEEKSKSSSLLKTLMVLFLVAVILGVYLFINSSKKTVVIDVNKEEQKKKIPKVNVIDLDKIEKGENQKTIKEEFKETEKDNNLNKDNNKNTKTIVNDKKIVSENVGSIQKNKTENKKKTNENMNIKKNNVSAEAEKPIENKINKINEKNNVDNKLNKVNRQEIKQPLKRIIQEKPNKDKKNEIKNTTTKDIIKQKDSYPPPDLDFKLLNIRNLIKNKKLKKAEAITEKIKNYPKSFAIVGKVKLLLGKYKEAEEYFKKAIMKDYSISFYVYHKHGLINRGCKGTFIIKRNMILFESFTRPDHSYAVSKRSIVKVQKHRSGYGFFVEREVKGKRISTTFLLVYKSNRKKNERFLADFINKYLLEEK